MRRVWLWHFERPPELAAPYPLLINEHMRACRKGSTYRSIQGMCFAPTFVRIHKHVADGGVRFA